MNGEEVEYWYEDGRLLYEKRGTDKEFYYSYDGYGNLSCIRYFLNGAQYTYYFLTNARGDVELIYGGSGVVLARYTYDSWGNTISIKDGNGEEITDPTNIALLNPIRYRGYYYDSETGLYYLQSRYYDPTTCRFVNADGYVSTGQGLLSSNMFAYCGNNPFNCKDPTGQVWETIFDIVSLAVSVIDVITNPSDPWAWISLAGDTFDLLPFVSGLGEGSRAISATNKLAKAADRAEVAAEATNMLRTGWKLGDDITIFTKAGKKPAWSTVKSRYWKNEAYFNPTKYSIDNLDLMKKEGHH